MGNRGRDFLNGRLHGVGLGGRILQDCVCAALKIWVDRMKRKQRKFGDRVQLVVDEMLHMLGHSSSSNAEIARGHLLQLTKLEERVLMSASPMAMVAEVATLALDASPTTDSRSATDDNSAGTHAVDAGNVNSQDSAVVVTDGATADNGLDSAATVGGIELIVIDSRVQDADTLLAELLNTDQDVRLLRLDGDRSGIEQITEKLEQLGNVSAIHLLTHGSDGQIFLGSTVLNSDTLAQHAAEFVAWQHNLTADADLLLYGCDVAETTHGKDFVAALAQLTQADVAASTDGTGSESLGGNWNLEYSVGSIDSTSPFRSDVGQDWNDLLASFVVTTVSDSGAGSLRQAILDANAAGGTDTITFNITGTGVKTINLASALPQITGTVVIDGWTQLNDTSTPLILIDANNTGSDGLVLTSSAGGSTIRGLVLRNFSHDAIWIQAGSNGNTIVGNYIGAMDGTGNAAGVSEQNGNSGIWIQGSANIIGGTTAALRNVISGNTYAGIQLDGTGATDNVLQGNYIGTNAAGTAVIANGFDGIRLLNGASSNMIGGSVAGAGNLISGNRLAGIGVYNTSSSNQILGNRIGTNAAETAGLGNGGSGIEFCDTASNNMIGGTGAGEGNVIAYNAAAGITVSATASGDAICGNKIYSNTLPGIDLGADGVINANDAVDVDSGANQLQNFPVLTSAVVSGFDLLVTGTFNSTANATFSIDIFSSSTADASGHGEAERYLGSISVTTDGSGNATFSQTLAGVNVVGGQFITATATNSGGNTSEFAANIVAVATSDMAIWRSKADTSPYSATWSGSSFGAAGNTSSVGEWRFFDGADSATRDEKILVGITTGGVISGEIYSSGVWSALPFTLNSSGVPSNVHAVDVVYEGVSGNAVLVWSNGTTGTANTSYRVWNGTSWSAEQTITSTLAGQAQQIKLAADPHSNNVILQVVNAASHDYAIVWNGSSWSNGITEGTATGGDVNDAAVAYESLTGDGLVVYDDVGSGLGADLNYRTLIGGVWSAQQTLTAPVGLVSEPDYVNIASDPGSDRVAISAINTNGELWVAVWDGNAWGSQLVLSTTGSSSVTHVTAVAFESISGDLLVTYGESAANTVRYQTWTSGGGWSGEIAGPDIGAVPNSMTLSSDPETNCIMLAVQDGRHDLHYVEWSGNVWGTKSTLDTDTGETANQPFLFLYDVAPSSNTGPVITSNGGAATAAVNVAENSSAVTTVTATDADLPARTLTYSISGGADAAKFTINSLTGGLNFVAAPDFEATTDQGPNNVYNVTVQVSDGAGGTDTQAIVVSIMGVNEAPTSISLAGTTVNGYINGATVSNVTVADPDAGDSWAISVSDSRFEVVSGVLRLKTSDSIDLIAEPSVNLSLTATDTGGESVTRKFTLTVTDPNSPSTLSITPITSSLQENTDTTAAIRVATIAVADDVFGTKVLALAGTDASNFQIVGTDLYLRAGTILDFEAQSSWNVTVNFNDLTVGLTPDDSATFSLTITDINEAPSMLISQTVTSVLENTSTTSAIVIAKINITDDALGSNALSLTGADASEFQIFEGNTLRLKRDTLLDADTKSSFTVIVNLRDSSLSGSPISSQAVTLIIVDIDEPPTANAGGPYTIFEGDALTVATGLSVDPEGLPLTYAWDIDADGIFTDATGSTATLTWNQLNALARGIHDNGSRTVSLKVTDAGGNSTIASTTLVITNTAPTVNVTGNATTSSGVPYVINLASSDPGNDTITTYRINWGDGVVENVAGTSSSASHRYLTPGGTRSITVNGTDEDGTFPMTGGAFIVTVLNTVPSVPVLSDSVVPSLTNGAVVGTMSFTDPDFGDSHTWTVSDNRFTVAGNVLRLKPDQQLNPVTVPIITLSATVTDASGGSNAATFTLRVNNSPVSVADTYAVDGTQQLSISSPSQGVLANDSDADGDALTATLVAGPSHAAVFGLNADGTFWYRVAVGFSGLDTFTYQVTDGENRGSATTVHLVVNQPPTIRYNSLVGSIPEHQTLSAPLQLGTVTISDDGIGTNTLTLVGSDAALFYLDAGNNLFLNAGLTIDFAVQTQFEVTTVLDDPTLAGSPDATQTLVFTVLDLNEVPTATAIPDVSIQEDASPGTISTAASFHDADNEPLTYSIRVTKQTTGMLKNISIDQTTGIIRYALNSNANGAATIRVTARDSSLAGVSSEFQLIVQPVNDAPVAQNYSNSTFMNKSLTVTLPGLRSSISDIDGDSVTVTLVSRPEFGTVVLLANGSFVYTPQSSFQGVDTFRFAASDGVLSSSVATATIFVIPQFIGPGNSSSNSNSSGIGASSSSSTTTSVSSVSTASNSSMTSTTEDTGNATSTSITSASSTGISAIALLNANGLASGISAAPAETTDNKGDEIFGLLPARASDTIVRIGGFATAASSSDSSPFTSNDFARRTSAVAQRFDFDQVFSLSNTNEEMMQLNAQRESLYRQLSARVVEQSDSVAEQLENSAQFKGRVVGSVGVVASGFSVGYVFWAVRGGMLVSGLLAQVPAWTMLDPLIVIDGEQKDEDKESLQNLMDSQQAKINRNEGTASIKVTTDGKLEA